MENLKNQPIIDDHCPGKEMNEDESWWNDHLQPSKYKYKVENAQILIFLHQMQKSSVDVHISVIDPPPSPTHHRQPSAILGLYFWSPLPPTL